MEEDKHVITPPKKSIFQKIGKVKQKVQESAKSTFQSVPLPAEPVFETSPKTQNIKRSMVYSREKMEKITTFSLFFLVIFIMAAGAILSYKGTKEAQKQKELFFKKPTTSPTEPPMTPAPSPTPSLTSDWKVYESETLGYT